MPLVDPASFRFGIANTDSDFVPLEAGFAANLLLWKLEKLSMIGRENGNKVNLSAIRQRPLVNGGKRTLFIPKDASSESGIPFVSVV
jgi:hypothetical protein